MRYREFDVIEGPEPRRGDVRVCTVERDRLDRGGLRYADDGVKRDQPHWSDVEIDCPEHPGEPLWKVCCGGGRCGGTGIEDACQNTPTRIVPIRQLPPYSQRPWQTCLCEECWARVVAAGGKSR